jgi:probable addiction module antidote protein
MNKKASENDEITDDDLVIGQWDVTKFLNSEEDIAEYLEDAFKDGDPTYITTALGNIARVRGMTLLSEQTGIGRTSLYKALSSEGNPELTTLLKVIHALGLQLYVRPTKA